MFGLAIGDDKRLPRDEVLKVLVDNHQWFVTNCKFICETFGTKISRLPIVGSDKYLKSMMKFINGKLKSRYGVTIKLVSKHSTDFVLNDEFALLFTDTFEIPEPVE
jgi:hypothetical protein